MFSTLKWNHPKILSHGFKWPRLYFLSILRKPLYWAAFSNHHLQCFRIWDLDARGYHNSMWRMRMKGSDVMVIGVPNSEYS